MNDDRNEPVGRETTRPLEEPVDRRQLARETVGKTSKWPPTERRQRRFDAVLRKRQPDLTVVLENVHDPHNVAAVLRSCDAVGVLHVHLVYTIESPPPVFARQTSASAAKWIDWTMHESIPACYEALRSQGLHVVATAWSESSEDLYEIDLTNPTALVFGNEMRGVSEEATQLADRLLVIPMVGMVQSLNISVACAVTLYEAFRQRRSQGMYDHPRLDDKVHRQLFEDWLRR